MIIWNSIFIFFGIWKKLNIDFWQFSIQFLMKFLMKIQFFEKWKNYKLLKSCLDLKNLSKSFKRNAKTMIQGACIQKTETFIVSQIHQSFTLKTHMKKGIIPISRVEHRWQPTRFFHDTGKWFWYKNSFLTNSLLMAASVSRNRSSDFDGLFYLHKLSNKDRYLQHFTTGFVGIKLTIAQASAYLTFI